MVRRTSIIGRKAVKFGKSGGFRGGYKVIEYLPNFGGRKEHGIFETRAEAQKYKKMIDKKYK